MHHHQENGTLTTVQLHPTELWIQLLFFYGFLAGCVSSTCSILIWTGIIRRRNLRTRFFIIVGCLTFVRTLICFQFLIMAVYRTLRTLRLVSPNQPRLVCHFIHFWLIDGWTVEMFLLFALVIDRTVAIVTVVQYRRMTIRSAFGICLAIFVLGSLVKLLPSYSLDDMWEEANCLNVYSFLDNRFNEYSQYIDLIMVMIILLCYSVLLIYTKIKVRRMKAGGDQQATADSISHVALRRQLKLMPILRNLVLMHCGLALTAKILLFLATISPECQQRCTAYGGMLSCLDVFMNVVILLVTNEDIRAAALPCCFADRQDPVNGIRMKTTAVVRVINIEVPDGKRNEV